MNFGPKVGPLVAELLSGFTILLLAYFDLKGLNFGPLRCLPGLGIAAIVLLAWIFGTFFDLLRNILEWVLDFCPRMRISWDFFFEGDEQKLANLDRYFYSFYMLDADMAISIILFLLFGRLIISAAIGPARVYGTLIHVVLLIVAAFFVIDAALLRCEIKELIDGEKTHKIAP